MKIFDLVWSKDNFSPCIVDLFARLPQDEEVLIRFEKGIYNFWAEGAFHSDRSVSALHAELRTFVFLLENKRNITIDGCGSEFIFHDRLSPFALFDCRNIKLCNLTIDFSFSRYCQGDVLSSDESGFELKIDETLFKTDVDLTGQVIFYSGNQPFSTADKVVLLGNAIFGKPPWDYIFSGDTQTSKENLPTGYIETDAMKTATGIRFNYRPHSRKLLFELGDTLIFCYEPRNNVNILSQGCKDILLENVAMYRGGGMGVIISDTENFSANRCTIQVRPGRNECRSTTADGFFFTQCTGRVVIQDSTIKNTLDDALNIHGLYTKVVAVEDMNKIKAKLIFQYESIIPFRKGDQITISDRNTHNRKYTGKLLECTVLPEGAFLLCLDNPVAVVQPGDQIENDSRSCDFIFRNNHVFQCPHVRISDNGLREVTGNHFEEIAGVLISDLYEYWLETGTVDNLKLENNTFTHCPRSGEKRAITIESTRKSETDVRHQNISIRNNRFIECNGCVIDVSCSDDLIISDNIFTCGELSNIIRISNCRNVRNENNAIAESK